MIKTVITLLFTFMLTLGVFAQFDFQYTGTTRPAWGNQDREIDVIIDVTIDSLYKQQEGTTTFYGLYFSYDIEFFENGVELPSNFEYNFWNLRLRIYCDNVMTDHGLIDNVRNQGFSGKGIAFNRKPLEDPNATLESLLCNEIIFWVEGPGLDDVAPSKPLPIELITFDAVKKERKVELSWKTATETNNDFFTLQRSLDGKQWEKVQTIDGAGNSTSVNEYAWTDYSPLAGVSYYKLQQTDFNGATTFFPIVSVLNDETLALTAYPNPVEHTITLSGINNENSIHVFNSIGVEITQDILISLTPSKKRLINMSNLSTGVYYISNGEHTIQVLKR
ncbi:hypothetical protein CW751_01355 [Brumimicrobium salinarum]|uniref:Secretion system C-terminal sorting domain-containing protein n=1 Tax=Brumimicrobium salinarum TaxID=2058658 RepID=A0A2I0R602_9FLAO|nr:T9SS type A sorting domain-containing protein [Brumimicrobium salinarum]PKR82012.1 hypothetical protein CW751_01355 [Brumimicrobium salinarum]